MKKYLLLASLFLATFGVHAQVVNGNFESGTGSWQWSYQEFLFGSGVEEYCAYPPLVAYTPVLNVDTTTNNVTAPASGRVAVFNVGSGPERPNYIVEQCRQITQWWLTVPTGKKLKFDVKIGDKLNQSPSGMTYKGYLLLRIGDRVTGARTDKAIADGQSAYCPIQSTCPKYITYTVDVSKFWGKSISLAFRGSSYYYRHGSLYDMGSPIYLDNVRFEP